MSKIKANFVSTKLNLPLFLISRNRIKSEQLDNVRGLIKKGGLVSHANNCKNENNIEKETVVQRKFRNMVGDYKEDKKGLLGKCIDKKGFTSSPGHSSKETAFHLPPNRYDTSKKPFSCKEGANGAYISTIGRKPLQTSTGSNPNEYNPVVSVKDRLHNYSNNFKGVFLRNSPIPSSRTMVSSLVTCRKYPNAPGPSDYVGIKDKKTTSKPRVKVNPHCFYRNSTAPILKNVIHKRHTSFTPGPGRYETRYWKICPCPSHKIYKPDLYLLVDREKRHKLRWEEYHKINIKKYCCPDWRHVIGGGYARLFRKIFKRPQVKDFTKPTIRRPPQITKWANALHAISARVKTHRELPEKLKEINYNTTMKVMMRKHRFNKIAFGSSVRNRFPAGRRSRKSAIRGLVPKISKHTTTKFRRIINFPILDKPISAIDARYKEVPMRLAPPSLEFSKKHEFKFSPLPTAKLLLSDEELTFKQKFPKLYNNPLDPLKYIEDPDQVPKEIADEMREFVAEMQCFGGDRNDCHASFSKLSIIRSKVSSMFS
uniref:Uncharacterized protein n=1 Tax=Glossina pallidipes TaxID=7398 RepID=A0A1A9ZBK4_GLOPL